MAHNYYMASLPALALYPGMIIRLEAFKESNGDPVTDVVCSEWAIYGDDLTPTADEVSTAAAGPFMLVPGPSA